MKTRELLWFTLLGLLIVVSKMSQMMLNSNPSQEYFYVTRGSLGRDRPVEVILEKERLIE